jgi:hypothetical protein
MRLPRLRLSIRWLMVAVAVVAFALVTFPGVYAKFLRWNADCRAQAVRHAGQERMARKAMADEAQNLGRWAALAAERRLKASGTVASNGEDHPPTGEASWASLAEQAEAQSAWHARMIIALHRKAADHAKLRRKWENAAVFPLLSVEADPPIP